MRLAFGILDLTGRVLLAFGIGFLLLGAYLGWQTLQYSGDSRNATGEVVSHHEIVASDDEHRYRPRVRFRTDAGEIITFEGQIASGAKRLAIGAQVPVIYRAGKPTEARIASFTDNWLAPTLAVIIGIVGMAGGWMVRRSIRRELGKRPV